MKIAAIVAALLLTGGALYLVLGTGDDEVAASDEDRGEGAKRKRPRSSARGGDGVDFDDDPVPRGEGSLEERVARLEREVATLRRAAAMRGRAAVSGAAAPGSIVDDPVLEEEVRGIYEEEREREREREMEIRRERFTEMRNASLDELVRVAGLTDDQRETIDGLWTTESDRMLPLFESMRTGDRPFTEIRDEIRKIRQETDDEARALLTERQYESYEEHRPRGRGGPGGRGGRGGRDRGEDDGGRRGE